MAATVSARGTLSPLGTGEADVDDSNVSSPLSEVDDGDGNEDDIENIQIDGQNDTVDNSSVSGDEQQDENKKIDRSDSESALSDAGSDDNSEANDTEAETERLYDTPRHQRQRDVVVDQYNQGQVFEHTPSKLRSAARLVDDQGNDHGDESASDDDPSIASGDDSPTKPTASNDTSVDGEGKRDSQERKRKRSPLADQTEADQPLRKRLTSVGAAEPSTDNDILANDDTASGNPESGDHSGGEVNDASTIARDVVTDSDHPDKETQTTKKMTRNGSKRNVSTGNNSPADTPRQEMNGETVDTADDDDTEHRKEDVEGDADENDAVAKSIEEAERKHAALKDWNHIEEMFGIFRDRLYKDRLHRLEEEEQSLLADVPTHPEYLNMKQCLDDRLERKVQEIDNEFSFSIEANERRAVALRAQVWSQFFQAVRERREAALESLNRQWYEVQTARRSAHSLPDYGLLFPKEQVRRVRNAVAYNTEVSTLAGLAKYEGFPAGPELKGASSSEVEADFSAIERVRRGRQKNLMPVRDDYPNPTFTRLGPAGEQFIKDTPWANPHHSSHKMQQQAPAAAPTRINPPTSSISPATAAGAPTSSDPKPTYDSQAPIHKSSAIPSRMSESPELSRSVLSPAAHKMKRVSSIPNMSRGSKTAAA